MDWIQLLQRIDREAARAFAGAARNVIDALLIEAERVQQAKTPEVRDYRSAGLSRTTPAGGWISDSELRRTSQELSEAIATERWVDGAVAAVRLLGRMGV